MNMQDQIDEWERQVEQAREYGLFFDREMVKGMLDVIKGQQSEIDWLRSLPLSNE